MIKRTTTTKPRADGSELVGIRWTFLGIPFFYVWMTLDKPDLNVNFQGGNPDKCRAGTDELMDEIGLMLRQWPTMTQERRDAELARIDTAIYTWLCWVGENWPTQNSTKLGSRRVVMTRHGDPAAVQDLTPNVSRVKAEAQGAWQEPAKYPFAMSPEDCAAWANIVAEHDWQVSGALRTAATKPHMQDVAFTKYEWLCVLDWIQAAPKGDRTNHHMRLVENMRRTLSKA